MDSGTFGGGAADHSRERHNRWGDGNGNNKVYTRKNLKRGLKDTTTAAATDNNHDGSRAENNSTYDNSTAGPNTTPTTTTTTTTASNNNNSERNKDKDDNFIKIVAPQQSSPRNGDVNSSPQQQQEQALSRCDEGASDSSPHVATELPNGNGVVKPVVTRVDDRVRISLGAASSKNDLRELKRKLVTELDHVRCLVKKLEAKEVQLTTTAYSGGVGAATAYGHPVNAAMEGRALMRVHSEVGSVGGHPDVIDRRPVVRVNSEAGSMVHHDVTDRRALVRMNSEVGSVVHNDPRPFRHLRVSVMENNHGMGEFVEKEKRTPKANQFYRNSDFLLSKDRLPPESKKLKSNGGGKKHGGEMVYGYAIDRYKSQVFKGCSNLLQRLMKHKHGWVFNEPVNAKAMGLHDYHDIIRHPMDLGTVKSRLDQNFYKSPRDFAADVRLTFRNAMTYNPRGQDVHVMAELLSNIFEERWAVIESEYNPEWMYETVHDSGLPTPTSRKAPTPRPLPLLAPHMRTFDRLDSMTPSVDSRLKPSNFPPVSRTPVPKKPKAKDPNKRDMTYEEKQKLSSNLQSLPSEKLDSIVQIIKKRNSALCQHDEEIEVDIDSVDAETLWELDRFVTNYKKSLSKNKRKAELAQARAEAGAAIPVTNPVPVVPEAPKDSRTDGRNISSSPVQGEKQGDNVSRSSSSSSSSSDSGSSSSDSDSDSSSADGSDAGQSPTT